MSHLYHILLKPETIINGDFKHNVTLNNLMLSDAGQYNCTYFFTSHTRNQFVKPSVENTVANNITIKCKYLL